jgi:hypothetical protein
MLVRIELPLQFKGVVAFDFRSIVLPGFGVQIRQIQPAGA